MSNFLLNLAHRSAGQSAVPQARPYLMPMFMPPSPVIQTAPTYMPPMPPAPTPFVPDESPRREVVIEHNVTQEVLSPPSSQDDDFARSLRPPLAPAPPLPEVRPRRESPPVPPAVPLPVQPRESIPDLPEPEIRIERTIETREVPVRAQPSPSILPEPPSIPRTSLPVEPTPIARDITPQPDQPVDDAVPQRAKPPPLPDLRPQPRREPPQTSQPDVPQTAASMPHQQVDESAPRRVTPELRGVVPAEIQPSLQLNRPGEPSVSLRPREIERMMTPAEPPPAPQRTVTAMPREEAAPRIPESTPSSIIVERVQPAEPSVRQTPIIRQESSTPSVDVRIGTIDLQFAPPAPPPASSAPRRRAHGFESFRRRRDYGGWED